MDTLPPELIFQVWLEADYDSLSKLCKVARASSDPLLHTQKAFCDDPQSWISRAAAKLGIRSTTFWTRTETEQTIPLPDSSEGYRAQMRYVELASRQGAVSDSHHFLSDEEIVKRAAHEGNLTLLDTYLARIPTRSYVISELSMDLLVDPKVAQHLGLRSYQKERDEIALIAGLMDKKDFRNANLEIDNSSLNLSIDFDYHVRALMLSQTTGPDIALAFFNYQVDQTGLEYDEYWRVLLYVLEAAFTYNRPDFFPIIDRIMRERPGLDFTRHSDMLNDVFMFLIPTDSYALQNIDYLRSKLRRTTFDMYMKSYSQRSDYASKAVQALLK